MGRLALEGALLFLLPFGWYALQVLLRRGRPSPDERRSTGTIVRLAVIGFILMIAGLLGLGLFAERHQGAYVPAHIENGRLVPGQIR